MKKVTMMLAVAALAAIGAQSFADESTGGPAGPKAPLLAKKNVPTVIAISLGGATALAVGLSGGSDHNSNSTSTATATTR